MSLQLAEQAIKDNKSVHLIYSGGSFPGKVREVLPIQIFDGRLLAFCKVRNSERRFNLEKSFFISEDEVENYPQASLPKQISNWQELFFLMSPYLDEQHKLHRELQSLKLMQDEKVLIELRYEEFDNDNFKRERPYCFEAVGKKATSYKEFITGANAFLDEFDFAYKKEVSLNYELSYLAQIKAHTKARAKSRFELICEVSENAEGLYILKTEHWAYSLKFGHREALGISFRLRQKNKKKYYEWVQSGILAFKAGDLFESNDGNSALQIKFSSLMGWDTENDEMYLGTVDFELYDLNSEGGFKLVSSHKCDQTTFLEILLTGEIEKAINAPSLRVNTEQK